MRKNEYIENEVQSYAHSLLIKIKNNAILVEKLSNNDEKKGQHLLLNYFQIGQFRIVFIFCVKIVAGTVYVYIVDVFVEV